MPRSAESGFAKNWPRAYRSSILRSAVAVLVRERFSNLSDLEPHRVAIVVADGSKLFSLLACGMRILWSAPMSENLRVDFDCLFEGYMHDAQRGFVTKRSQFNILTTWLTTQFPEMTWPEMDFCEGDNMSPLGTSCVDTFGFQPD